MIEIKDMGELKTKIIEAVASVRPEMLVKKMKEVKSTLEMLLKMADVMLNGELSFSIKS